MSAVSQGAVPSLPSNYKWIVLSNTTIGMLPATRLLGSRETGLGINPQ